MRVLSLLPKLLLPLLVACAGDVVAPDVPIAAGLAPRISAPPTSSLAVGSSLTLQLASHGASQPSSNHVTWSSSDGGVLRVGQASGIVDAIAAGATFVRVETPSGRDSIRLQVRSGPVSTPGGNPPPSPPVLRALDLAPDSVTLVTGTSRGFNVVAQWSDSTTLTPALVWTSSDTTIARVSVTGNVTAVGPGRASITARAGSLVARAAVTVPVPTITVSPMELPMRVGQATRLTAISTGWAADTVRWTSSAVDVAIVDESGQVTAIGAGTAIISAHSRSGAVATTAVTVSPTAPVLTGLALSPDSLTITAGTSAAFVAVPRWSDGSSAAPAVTWTASGGTINSSGLYTAGTTAGTFTVTATQQGGSVVGKARVTVAAPRVVGLEISPKASSLQAGESVQYSTAATWSDGQSRPYTISYSATGGTVTSGGLYRAGASAGTFLIIATCSCGLADTAHATVLPPAAPVLSQMVLTPASVTLASGATRQFTVAGVWSDGSTAVPAVTYKVTGGTITAGGLYTAGVAPGSYRVIATQSGGTRADASVVTIPAPTLAQLVLSPATVTLAAGATQQFTVAGLWSDGSTSAPRVSWSTTGGVITPDGLYTAGSTPGVFSIVARQIGGTRVDTSSVTVVAPSLRQLASARGFQIGVAVRDTAFSKDAAFRQILSSQFNSLVPEDATDFWPIHPGPTSYNFGPADALVNFAQANGMVFHGHTLIWESWIPTWVTSGGYSRDSLFGVMRSHITAVVGHFRGKAASWDVLNEMLDNWPGTTLKPSFWLSKLGPEYMDSAFVWARRADPEAKLYINEYFSEFSGPKADALFALVQEMRSRGVPIDGVGFQMHASTAHPSYPDFGVYATNPIGATVYNTFARFANAGYDIRITEFDAELADTEGPSALTRQGQVYRDVLDACLRVSRCKEMTMWGMTDRYSWIPGSRPGYGRGLPFDSNYLAKPAFDSLTARMGRP